MTRLTLQALNISYGKERQKRCVGSRSSIYSSFFSLVFNPRDLYYRWQLKLNLKMVIIPGWYLQCYRLWQSHWESPLGSLEWMLAGVRWPPTHNCKLDLWVRRWTTAIGQMFSHRHLLIKNLEGVLKVDRDGVGCRRRLCVPSFEMVARWQETRPTPRNCGSRFWEIQRRQAKRWRKQLPRLVSIDGRRLRVFLCVAVRKKYKIALLNSGTK